MKLIATFKNPDWEDSAFSHMTADECDAAREALESSGVARKFFKYGEYVKIELDTEKGTATVLKA